MQVTTEEADKYQNLFNLMFKKHNVMLTIDEMNEVIDEAKKISRLDGVMPTCASCKHYDGLTCSFLSNRDNGAIHTGLAEHWEEDYKIEVEDNFSCVHHKA